VQTRPETRRLSAWSKSLGCGERRADPRVPRLYHVLGGALSPLDGVGPERLHLADLFERARTGAVREIIVATNPNMAGEATALYIAEELRELTSAGDLRITNLPPACPWVATSSMPTR